MKPTLTILTHETEDGVLARGISEDVTLFDHAHFPDRAEVKRYCTRTFGKKFNVILPEGRTE